MLTPTDLYILCGIIEGGPPRTYWGLAHYLLVGISSVHAALHRGHRLGLVAGNRDVVVEPFLAFVEHGVPYAFAARRLGPAVGIATGRSYFPVSGTVTGAAKLGPVWPDPRGHVEGYGIAPLHRKAPRKARRDTGLGRILAAIDLARDADDADERRLAVRILDGHARQRSGATQRMLRVATR